MKKDALFRGADVAPTSSTLGMLSGRGVGSTNCFSVRWDGCWDDMSGEWGYKTKARKQLFSLHGQDTHLFSLSHTPIPTSYCKLPPQHHLDCHYTLYTYPFCTRRYRCGRFTFTLDQLGFFCDVCAPNQPDLTWRTLH